MRSHARLAALALAGTLIASSATAEPVGRYFYLVPFGGVTVFDSDLKYPTAPLADELNFGGRFGYQWLQWLGIEVGAGYTPTHEDIAGGQDVDFYHVSGDFMFTPFQGRWGGPFLMAGAGGSNLKVSEAGPETNQGNAEFGGGLQFWFSDGVGARIEARDLMWMSSENTSDIQAHTLVLGAGITIALGAKGRDTDLDKVSDSKDKCPDTPKGATVDADGCPKDTDGDKVLDGIDQCEGTPKGATVTATGCTTDADGDGVVDGIDQCADTPKGATVDATGCPKDSDGDGVFDGIDQCASTPTGAQVDSTGCPRDTDGDGVFDGIDQCPETPLGYKVDATGCAIEVIERETELLDTGMMRIDNIKFETGKAILAPESYGTLDVVGAVLSKWPELKMEIGGHTDSRGSEKLNQSLSEARAKAVLDYLNQKYPGLKEEQYTVKGYGESKPFVPNNSPENMTLNRRVEFVVLNKETLRKEYERRRLLKQGETTPPAPEKK
jgi:outer membrane protein OmpA-like peptidoglycan-associated protein